jgi:hypothetical protein
MSWYKPITREASFMYGLITGAIIVTALWVLFTWETGVPPA